MVSISLMSYVFIDFRCVLHCHQYPYERSTHLQKIWIGDGFNCGLVGLVIISLLTHTDTQASSIVDCIDGPYIELPIALHTRHDGKDIWRTHLWWYGENGLTFTQRILNRLQNPFIEALKSKSLIASTKEFSPLTKKNFRFCICCGIKHLNKKE